MRCSVAFLVFGFLLLPAWASNPGEPLDCSDWVFLEADFSCGEFPTSAENPPSIGSAIDNEGRVLSPGGFDVGTIGCSGVLRLVHRHELRAWDHGTETVV